jgi:cell division protein ZapA
MAEVTLTINGRNYGIACDDGQEERVRDLGYYIDQRMREIAKAGAANNEVHLMILTSLMLADEVFDLKDNVGDLGERVRETQAQQYDEVAIAEAINELAERIDSIAGRVQKA